MSESTGQSEAVSDAPACSLARLRVLAKICRNRGGTCECRGRCKAAGVAQEKALALAYRRRKIEAEEQQVENILKRLNAPMATLREGFKFREGLTPVVVFDGDEATFGYEDKDGEWIESGEWPFNDGFVWYDDCERFGIRVE